MRGVLPGRRSAARLLLAALLTMVLAAVLAVSFAAYLQPDFMLDVANRIMLCF